MTSIDAQYRYECKALALDYKLARYHGAPLHTVINIRRNGRMAYWSMLREYEEYASTSAQWADQLPLWGAFGRAWQFATTSMLCRATLACVIVYGLDVAIGLLK